MLLRDRESMPRTASVSLSSLLHRSNVLAFALEMVFGLETAAGTCAAEGALIDDDDDVTARAEAALIFRSRRAFKSIAGAGAWTSFTFVTLAVTVAFLTTAVVVDDLLA